VLGSAAPPAGRSRTPGGKNMVLGIKGVFTRENFWGKVSVVLFVVI
jgi:hypothetical protein